MSWILVLTIVSLDGTTAHLTERVATETRCTQVGQQLSTTIAPSVQSTGFICAKLARMGK